jgi:hypothetical protein
MYNYIPHLLPASPSAVAFAVKLYRLDIKIRHTKNSPVPLGRGIRNIDRTALAKKSSRIFLMSNGIKNNTIY